MRLRRADPASSTVYLSRANEFFGSMNEAMSFGRWNSVGLEGVHCAISATDALLAKKAGVRSSGESHAEAAGLLREHIRAEGVSEQVRRLLRILGYKNRAAYEGREFTRQDAEVLAKDVTRYFRWVQELLIKP